MADISKILIPALDGSPGGIYNIKDTVAREMLAGGINYFIAWNGQSVPNVANIPNTVSVRYNDTVYTGTLAPSDATPMTLYLIYNGENGSDNFIEYAAVTDDQNVKFWEALGETGAEMSNLGALAYMDSVDLDKGQGVNVIGENATLQASSSSVTFGNHTTANVLGTSTTFSVTDATYSLSPTKGNITLTRSTDVAITPSSTTVLSALNTSTSTKATFLKSDTTFTKKKIATATVRGVASTTSSASVDFTGSVKRKLLTDTVIPAKSKTINGSDLITGASGNLVTKDIRPVQNKPVTVVNSVSKDTGTLDTDTINKVSAITTDNPSNNEWKDTVANLDIHMYSSVTDGTSGVFANADNETLVISFKTLPSLKISTANATYAKGNIAGASGAATVVTDVSSTTTSVAALEKDQITVATGSVAANGTGATVLTGFTSSQVTVAETDTAKRFATGSIAANNTQNNNEQYGGEVYNSLSGSVQVPQIDANATDVLIPTLQNATSSSTDVNVVTGVTPSTGDAYTAINFETSNVHNGITSITQPEFNASISANSSGSVLTGVTINKDTSGNVSVASGNTPVAAITAIGTATAAAQDISFANKDLKKVPLYDDLKIVTEANPIKRYLNFMMPLGGTITLGKNGSPTARVFEYSFDGVNWITWEETTVDGVTARRMTIASGDRFFVRNASATSTSLNAASHQYQFSFDKAVYAYGNIMSLLCKTPENATMPENAFRSLFSGADTLIKTPDMPSTTTATNCYYYTYYNCSNLEIVAELPAKSVKSYAYSYICAGCGKVKEIRTRMTSLSTGALNNWLQNVASTGTLYVVDELGTIPDGVSGLPTGWTKVVMD